DKQTLLRSGVEEIGTSLKDISLTANEILQDVTAEMEKLQGDSLLLGEVSNSLLEKYSKFKSEFPRFIKEIDNYSQFMSNTLTSYKETDTTIETAVSEKLNSEIAKLTDSGNIGT
ncbi:MAG: hypothetical protein K2I72_01320, partial [Bacilli bacterium]|nr:hypothetical protein [Bacilli bacterium]